MGPRLGTFETVAAVSKFLECTESKAAEKLGDDVPAHGNRADIIKILMTKLDCPESYALVKKAIATFPPSTIQRLLGINLRQRLSDMYSVNAAFEHHGFDVNQIHNPGKFRMRGDIMVGKKADILHALACASDDINNKVADAYYDMVQCQRTQENAEDTQEDAEDTQEDAEDTQEDAEDTEANSEDTDQEVLDSCESRRSQDSRGSQRSQNSRGSRRRSRSPPRSRQRSRSPRRSRRSQGSRRSQSSSSRLRSRERPVIQRLIDLMEMEMNWRACGQN
uniref:Uncharacterized protein n=1 Tax=viral metagenome TaxID=1070528 RepID=A0A6C0BNX9_9ZZZZ